MAVRKGRSFSRSASRLGRAQRIVRRKSQPPGVKEIHLRAPLYVKS